MWKPDKLARFPDFPHRPRPISQSSCHHRMRRGVFLLDSISRSKLDHHARWESGPTLGNPSWCKKNARASWRCTKTSISFTFGWENICRERKFRYSDQLYETLRFADLYCCGLSMDWWSAGNGSYSGLMGRVANWALDRPPLLEPGLTTRHFRCQIKLGKSILIILLHSVDIRRRNQAKLKQWADESKRGE